MSNIIEFPKKSVRNDAEIEKALRESISGYGFPNSVVDSTVSNAMSLIQESRSTIDRTLKFQFKSSLTDEQIADLESNLSSVFQDYQQEISGLVLKLILKIALLEARASDV